MDNSQKYMDQHILFNTYIYICYTLCIYYINIFYIIYRILHDLSRMPKKGSPVRVFLEFFQTLWIRKFEWHHRGPRTTKMKILLQLYLTTWMVQEMWEVGRDSERCWRCFFEMYLQFLRWFPPPRNIIETGEKRIWSSRYGKYPIIARVIHPRWCRISSINSMILYEGGYPRHMMLSQIIAWVLVSVPKALMNLDKIHHSWD